MNRSWIAVAFAALIGLPLVGCTMCEAPEDTYGYFGGLYQRPDPTYGRAGSIITAGDEVVADEGTVVEDDVYYEE